DLEAPAGALPGADPRLPADVGRRRRYRPAPAGEFAVGVVVVVEGQADLLEVVLTAQAVGRCADLLYRGQEQADEDGDDGDHHQQLDQREAPARARERAWRAAHAQPPQESGDHESGDL